MKTHLMAKTEIPLDDSWDVIVAGGGPAGCAAAVGAAREGARTLLVEATGCLGGMATSGLVNAFMPFSDGERLISCGLAEKVLDSLAESCPEISTHRLGCIQIDCELMKRIYDDMVAGSGARILFNTMLASVGTDSGGKVSTITVCNKAGLNAFSAKTFVDCTGDADLAARAGAEYEKGDQDGTMQPATHCFAMSNVDVYGYKFKGGWSMRHKLIDDILESGKYPEIVDRHACNGMTGPGVVTFNGGHVYDVDGTDPFSVSDAMIEGRKIAAGFERALREFCPSSFGNCFLSNTGALLGVRETRRVLGDYYLTLDDYRSRRSFDDEICRSSYAIDVHGNSESLKKIIEDKSVRYGKGESFGIPYRCLAPAKLRNVTVAGRCVSSDRYINGSLRIMPVCMNTGEAAGMAAAMAAKGDGDVHSVDVNMLRKRLKEEGAYLP